MNALGKAAFAAIALLLVIVSVALAAEGDLDTSFDGDGLVTTPLSAGDDGVHALLALPGGGLLAGGSGNAAFSLVQYDASGALDPGFGSDGKVQFPVGPDGEVTALALQSNGRIVATGSTWSSGSEAFVVARFNADGSIDSSFGSGGKVIFKFASTGDFSQAVALAPDGKIVVAGISLAGTPSNQTGAKIAVARLTSGGVLDATFDGDGRAVASVGTSFDKARGVVVQPDGKVVAAGDSHNADDDHDDFAFVRFTATGGLDPDFGDDGAKVVKISALHDDAHALGLQADGKLVAAGFSNSETRFALVRLTDDGELDKSFSSDGIVTSAVPGFANAGVNAVAFQNNGRIVAGGFAGNGSNHRFAVARYSGGGNLDSSFGAGGIVTAAVGPGGTTAPGKAFCDGVSPSCAGAHAIAILENGSIAAGGSRFDGTGTDWQLARFSVTAATGPTGEPTGPTGNPTGPTSDPGPTVTGDSVAPPPVIGRPGVTATSLQRLRRLNALVGCYSQVCDVRASARISLPGRRSARSRTAKAQVVLGAARVWFSFSKRDAARIGAGTAAGRRLTVRLSVRITGSSTGSHTRILRVKLRR